MFPVRPELEKSKQFVEDTLQGVSWLLEERDVL